jgi:hypothetical protein
MLPQPIKAHAEMPEGDARNVGSVFAAGTQCETSGYMPQGQVTPLIVRAIQHLPSIDSKRIREGYQEGLKRRAIFSKNFNRWAPYPLTAEGCKQVQYAIKQYKIAFDMIDDTVGNDNKVGLVGPARSSFVKGVADSCLREQNRKPLPISASSVAQYCKCYANGLADRLSVSQLNAQEKMGERERGAAMKPIVESAAKPCVAAALNSR